MFQLKSSYGKQKKKQPKINLNMKHSQNMEMFVCISSKSLYWHVLSIHQYYNSGNNNKKATKKYTKVVYAPECLHR